ncbi:MAG: glycosyltransferase family 2 protein [Candidatus Cellulosilyticum pullistercoris]|uniref:Glycosyltransferase family 2 protein n=1 Tax=Candidatus Cellulosilyticum pullistercoris TaxID=2838521 RepID=A0A9E2KEM5_9FIRM|nr:glycosyltransferase family 2 protein [Candidatus Cellulosilyticum pullistercoris]
MVLYSTYLFASALVGAFHLFRREQQRITNDQISHPFYVPVSIIVPAYNEEVTIVESIHSLLKVDYRLYEIIIVDDGSKDDTVKVLLEAFPLKKTNRPIHKRVQCKAHKEIYEAKINNIHVTLISKENGGKGDSLNMGINASRFPYFICIDADSLLQKDSLEKIVKPVFMDESVIAVGGLIRISQCVEMEDGEIKGHKIPINPVVGMQAVEYLRTFLASRILKDTYGGNLIISGAFGLFKKDIVIAVGGYDSSTLGEDMELVVKMHVFCRNHLKKYKIAYEPEAVCWSQAPSSLKDLTKQRRRWHLGLFQCLTRYYYIFGNLRFGLVSFVSYLYYLFFELLAPFIEVLGIFTMVMAYTLGLLNHQFLINLFILYSLFSVILTITVFFQMVYVEHIKISFADGLKAILICILEGVFFRYVLSFIRITSFIGYKKKKHSWGAIQRTKHVNHN